MFLSTIYVFCIFYYFVFLVSSKNHFLTIIIKSCDEKFKLNKLPNEFLIIILPKKKYIVCFRILKAKSKEILGYFTKNTESLK